MNMKLIYHALYAALLCLSLSATAQNKPKNIVFIFADDLGYMDVGFNGAKFAETPNLDKLSRNGMVFNNAYAGAGNCAPSRACLISGNYTPRHGVYAVGSTTRGPKKEMKVVPIPNTADLKPAFVTMAESLKAAGYKTGIFGKWHLGKSKETSPLAQGFDVYFDSREENPNKLWNIPDDPKGTFSNTRAALSFIKENKDKPFFVYMSHHAIHGGLEARPETIKKFEQKNPKATKQEVLYAGCTYDMDASVGMIMDVLKEQGLDKNTLVVFTSDNGAMQKVSQEPLRCNKGSYYEGGIKEPFFAYLPGYIKPGVNQTPIINLDLYPTFCEIAKAKAPGTIDGESLLPIFDGRSTTTKRKSIFWHFPGYLDKPGFRGRDSIFRTRPVSAMRQGDWKILLYHEEWILDGGLKNINTNHAVELYNLKADGGERNDLAGKETAKRDQMVKDLLVWMKAVDAKLPHKIDAAHQLSSDDGGEDEN
jgi:arylsulfatase A-like enzyme